jgi:hypothetical protein
MPYRLTVANKKAVLEKRPPQSMLLEPLLTAGMGFYLLILIRREME